MIAALVTLASAGAWLYLLACRGRFWDVRLPPEVPAPPAGLRVAVVIPARDEAECIGRTVTALLAQDFPGELGIVLVDDHSSDCTADLARAAAARVGAEHRLTVLQAEPLPQGWTGKLWAVSQGIAYATKAAPDFLLLTDADIVHAPGNVASLASRAVAEQRDLVSQMVLLRSESFAERALIPAFVFFFFMLYPPRWAADPNNRLAAAAGGSMLIRPALLERIGGIGAIRGALIDDCALAAAVKQAGGRIRLDVTDAAHSIREYGSFGEIWQMVARTAFTQLHYSSLLLVGTILGLGVTYLAPPLLLHFGVGWEKWLAAATWIAMAAAFRPTVRLYGLGTAWAFALPLIACFYAAATIGSAVNYWRGRGGQWKGRAQAA